ncbi:MAG: leucyl/phenylalanyl-tRNA--protein transferase [Rhodospirillaceae bacterium]|nr:leucyl/phenylalanyl-tRNA--protein transferase [Rhodospirillaceae bacterium]HAA91993.1 leucyl/phenylalanyl-tRNA--protein transferase [Rhodospirillaceae bacterium]
MPDITPDLLLKAYAVGVFPMAEDHDDPDIFWVDPRMRGILPLDRFHVPRRLKRTVRSDRFEVTADRDFEAVIESCAEAADDRPRTWINNRIIELYTSLHHMGHAHSIECWRDGELVGGLYGVVLGGIFFGESMFTRERDASKVALVHLVARMHAGGFAFVDTQFITKHLTQFGAIEIPRTEYRSMLDDALQVEACFKESIGDDILNATLDQKAV